MKSEMRSCRMKRRYGSMEKALRRISVKVRLGEVTQGYLHAYECRFCHGWHIGHAQPRHLQVRPIRRQG